jgi:hypothetical protein
MQEAQQRRAAHASYGAAVLCLSVILACHAPAAAQDGPVRPWAFTFENDVFVNSDDNYTDGVQVEWAEKRPPGRMRTLDLLNTACRTGLACRTEAEVTVRTRIGQLMYTPTDIRNPAPQPDKRPWAGMLYFHRTWTVPVNVEEDVTLGALVGVIGPAALTRQTQKFIHKHVMDAPDPQGWHHQIRGSLGLMATLERRKAAWLDLDAAGVGTNGAWYWRVGAGNVMTYAAVGATVMLGQNLPALARDDSNIQHKALNALPGRCLGQAWLSCSIHANVELRAMAYNVFLDGRWRKDDPSVDSKPLVLDASIGLRLGFPALRSARRGTPFVMLRLSRRSAEYRSANPDGPQAWGAISVGTDFN